MTASAASTVTHPTVTRHVTASGARIYTIGIRAFEHLGVNVFLVVVSDPQQPSYTALIDAGSSFDFSQQGLLDGLKRVREEYGEAWSWETLSRLVITHPHPDHVGGLPFVRTLTAAPVAAHALAAAVIEEPGRRAEAFKLGADAMLARLGVPEGEYAARLRRRAGNLMSPSGVKVETALQDGDTLDGLFTVLHTPGHDGAQICLRLDEVLLSADHLLPHNSPPLMPGWMLPGSGLGPYLAALDHIETLEGVDLALGSHDEPMPDWRGRVDFLRRRYDDKLRGVLGAASEPQTIYALTCAVNPRLRAAQALLLLDQTAALVEELVVRGELHETREQAADGERWTYQRA